MNDQKEHIHKCETHIFFWYSYSIRREPGYIQLLDSWLIRIAFLGRRDIANHRAISGKCILNHGWETTVTQFVLQNSRRKRALSNRPATTVSLDQGTNKRQRLFPSLHCLFQRHTPTFFFSFFSSLPLSLSSFLLYHVYSYGNSYLQSPRRQPLSRNRFANHGCPGSLAGVGACGRLGNASFQGVFIITMPLHPPHCVPIAQWLVAATFGTRKWLFSGRVVGVGNLIRIQHTRWFFFFHCRCFLKLFLFWRMICSFDTGDTYALDAVQWSRTGGNTI